MILAKLQLFHWITRTVSNCFISFIYMKINSNFLFHLLSPSATNDSSRAYNYVKRLMFYVGSSHLAVFRAYKAAQKLQWKAFAISSSAHCHSFQTKHWQICKLFAETKITRNLNEVKALSRKFRRETSFWSFCNYRLRPLQSFSELCKYEKQIQCRQVVVYCVFC